MARNDVYQASAPETAEATKKRNTETDAKRRGEERPRLERRNPNAVPLMTREQLNHLLGLDRGHEITPMEALIDDNRNVGNEKTAKILEALQLVEAAAAGRVAAKSNVPTLVSKRSNIDGSPVAVRPIDATPEQRAEFDARIHDRNAAKRTRRKNMSPEDRRMQDRLHEIKEETRENIRKRGLIGPEQFPQVFTNKRVLPNGMTIYNVSNNFSGQLAVRKIADSHFGKDFNGWCIIDRSTSKLPDAIELAWDKGHPLTHGATDAYLKDNVLATKRIAFDKDGNLLAFSALSPADFRNFGEGKGYVRGHVTSGNLELVGADKVPDVWYDRWDAVHNGIPVHVGKTYDEVVPLVNSQTGEPMSTDFGTPGHVKVYIPAEQGTGVYEIDEYSDMVPKLLDPQAWRENLPGKVEGDDTRPLVRQDAKGGDASPKNRESTAPTVDQLREALEFLEMFRENETPSNEWEARAIDKIYNLVAATYEKVSELEPAPAEPLEQPGRLEPGEA